MRTEQALKSYTLENVAFHVLRKRFVASICVFLRGISQKRYDQNAAIQLFDVDEMVQ